MTVLYVLLGIALFLIFLLISSVSIKCNISEEINVKLRYLLYNKTLFPLENKSKREKRKEFNTDDIEKIKPGKLRQMIDEKGLFETIGELTETLKIIISKFGNAAKHIRVRKCYLTVNVASSDPANTAVEYGLVCSVVYPAVSGFQELLKWHRKKTVISVNSDFCSEKPSIDIDLKIKLRLWFIIKLGLGILCTLIKIKFKDAFNKQKCNINSKANVNNKVK